MSSLTNTDQLWLAILNPSVNARQAKRGGCSSKDPGAVELGLDCRVSVGHVLAGAAYRIQLALTNSRICGSITPTTDLMKPKPFISLKGLIPASWHCRSHVSEVTKCDFLTRMLMMPNVATAEELRRKAEECRTDAHQFIVPETKAHMLATAAEYERLAMRAAQFEQRSPPP